MSKLACWIEAMRLRTLPVSVAGVIGACGYALLDGKFKPAVAVLCLLFAVLAQIASNFANEYYDFKGGLDRKGREGPRRGVTEGDLTPGAMKAATFVTLGLACCVGLSLLLWGPWWLILAGVAIALGVLAYSTGPYPLSHHGLGEVAVVFFFGIIPVNLTYLLMCGSFTSTVLMGSVALGLMGANVLVVNNYRDYDDDRAVGKHTLLVMIGRQWGVRLYDINAVAAYMLVLTVWLGFTPHWLMVFPCLYLVLSAILSYALAHREGARLNPLLGMTACLMLLYAVLFTATAALC